MGFIKTWNSDRVPSSLCWKCMQQYFLTTAFFLTVFTLQAFGDAAINKEISELKVHCVTLGCGWSGIMKNFEVGLKAVYLH